MYTPRSVFANICTGASSSNLPSCVVQHLCQDAAGKGIRMDRVLVVSKFSKYEFERKKHKHLNDKELEKLLRKRGTNFDKLVHFHNIHKRFEERLTYTLREMGINVEVENKIKYGGENVNNADVIIPAGGDGTFLLAASRVLNNVKPVVGFNSDPNRSEGYLCLPKRYTENIREAVERLQQGNFSWLMRSRIRTTYMACEEDNLRPTFLHDTSGLNENGIPPFPTKCDDKGPNVLPVLALNEVFMGETVSARVSHLQMKFNGTHTSYTNLKCSGLCVATGTGSTSWHLSINRLPAQSVAELLRLLEIDSSDAQGSLATTFADVYNRNLVFAPDDKRMAYTIRDLISATVWPQPKGIKPRGFVNQMEITSHCIDASLVIDGGVSFKFNDGTVALLEILPEDALRTVILRD
nr:unnamed protein product [Callosobruchus chinensis]